MNKIRQRRKTPFPNLSGNWLENTVPIALHKLTGFTPEPSSIEYAMEAFVSKYSSQRFTSLEEIMQSPSTHVVYQFESKDFNNLDLDCFHKN